MQMFRATYGSRSLNHLLLTCLVLFSLAPCSVKAPLFGLSGSGYTKPVSPSKTTVHSAHCQYAGRQVQKLSFNKQFNISRQVESAGQVLCSPSPEPQTVNQFTACYTGKSPPRYILYKCLRTGAC